MKEIYKNTELLKSIQSFQFDDPEANLTFSERLARENGWTLNYALRVIDEYKKFMYMIAVSGQPLTPSDQVDQVWHLHLVYTQSYWKDWCQNIFGKEIHHGPTKGGDGEKGKFEDWYLKTLRHYEDFFNKKPPIDIWPDSKIRFQDINFTRINRNKFWVIKKPL